MQKNDMLAHVAGIESHTAALRAEILMLLDEVAVEVTPEPTPVEVIPEPTAPAAFLPMKVRTVPLTLEQIKWLQKLKATKSWSDPTATYNMERLASTGRLNDLSRWLTLFLPAIIAALRVTGDIDILEKVYRVSRALRRTLNDANGDDFRGWLQSSPDDSLGGLEGTDDSVMEETMAHATIAQIAYLFKLNAQLDPKYAAESAFWLEYLVNDFEAKWRRRNNKPSGYPVLVKDLMHPFTNSVRYMGYMVRLTGDPERKGELDRLLAMLHGQLCHDGPDKLVWTHGVNALRQPAGYGWLAQPAGGYAGESCSALADLGFEGWLGSETMTRIARAVSVNVLDGKTPGIGARTILGDTSRMVYSTFHKKDVRLNIPADEPKYARMTSYSWQARGYALLEPWDASGEIAATSRRIANQADVYPIPAVGALLAVSR